MMAGLICSVCREASVCRCPQCQQKFCLRHSLEPCECTPRPEREPKEE